MRHKKFYLWGLAYAFSLLTAGVLAGDVTTLGRGLWTIFTSPCGLITDYFALAGPGAAFVNSALVSFLALGVLWLCRDPVNGMCCAVLGLNSGFAFFGKNVVNMLPILLGSWLYAKSRGEPFARYAPVGLMAGALGPLVSFCAFSSWGAWYWGLLAGVVIGFLLPPLAAHTFRILDGMNLYNVGFACGLFALVTVPLFWATGLLEETTLMWSTEYQGLAGGFLGLFSLALVVCGILMDGKKGLVRYGRILKTSGQVPSDYLLRAGSGATLLNMGINGLAALLCAMVLGWDLNGPTLGAILSIMGFSAYGKHLLNILPIMAGVALGGFVLHGGHSPAVQLAGLFGTCLAPISGKYGWPIGVLAGFLHSVVVLRAGVGAEGFNLYNNGFCAGILAVVLCGILSPLLTHQRAEIMDDDFFDVVLAEDEEDW